MNVRNVHAFCAIIASYAGKMRALWSNTVLMDYSLGMTLAFYVLFSRSKLVLLVLL